MSKVEKVKFIRTLTIIGCTIACIITVESKSSFVGAISVFPFTCLSGVCAFIYHRLDKNDRIKSMSYQLFICERLLCIHTICLQL